MKSKSVFNDSLQKSQTFIFNNLLVLFSRFFFSESNTTSYWLNYIGLVNQDLFYFHISKPWRKRQRVCENFFVENAEECFDTRNTKTEPAMFGGLVKQTVKPE